MELPKKKSKNIFSAKHRTRRRREARLMHGITFPMLLSSNAVDRGRPETPSISAVSPSGLRLAYALNANLAVTDENSVNNSRDAQQHIGQPTSHRRKDSCSSDDNNPPAPPLLQYRVVITGTSSASTTPQSAAICQLSDEKPASSSSSAAAATADALDVNTCPLKAPITTLCWLDETHLACGQQDGTVTIVSHRRSGPASEHLSENDPGRREWTPTLSRCFHRVQRAGGGGEDTSAGRVVCIRLSGEGIAGGASAVGGTRGSELTLWVLYGGGVVVCVGVEALVTIARCDLQLQQLLLL